MNQERLSKISRDFRRYSDIFEIKLWNTGLRTKNPPSSVEFMEADLQFQSIRAYLQLLRYPRPPLSPPLRLEPPGHLRQEPHVSRDPAQAPPHSHEKHPCPVILHARQGKPFRK